MNISGSANRRAIALSVAFAINTVSAESLAAEPKASSEKMEEVVVIASKVPVPVRGLTTAVSTLTAGELRLRGHMALVDALRTQAGIGASNAGGPGKATSLRIRGEEAYRTLVMIDGIDVSDPTGPQVGPPIQHLLITDAIKKVEVLRGPQGFLYGADAGGVIAVQTRLPDTGIHGEVAAEAGTYETQKLAGHIGAGSAPGDLFLSATDVSTDGFNSHLTDMSLEDDDGYDNTTIHFRAGLNLSDALRMEVIARDVDATVEYDRCFATHDCIEQFKQTNAKLSADYAGSRVGHHLAYENTDISRENIEGGIATFDTEGEINRLEYWGDHEGLGRSRFIYGADFEREEIDATGAGMERDQLGLYVEYETRITDSVFVTAGMRRDDNDDFGVHTSYRLSGAYLRALANDADLKFRAAWGTGFRAPSPSEIAYNDGAFARPPASATELSEERSSGLDIGMEYFAGTGNLYLELVYFEQQIEDRIFFDLTTFSGYLQGRGVTESRGVEMSAEYSMAPRWTFLGNLTFNETRDRNDLDRIRRPEQMGNLGLRFAADRLTLFANLRFARNAQDETFGAGRFPLDDYHVLDVSARYRLSRNVDLTARVENVTDREYVEVAGYRTSGTAFYGGARVRL